MAALDGIKAIWNDPKKRPFVLAGAGVATGAGVLAMRRPTDPEEAALEDQAAAEAGAGTDPLGADTAGAYEYGGTLPPVYALGGAGDDAFAEQDLSGIYAELDALGSDFQGQLDESLQNERDKNRKARQRQKERLKAAEKRLANQRKRNRQQDKRIARLSKRGKSRPRGKGKSGGRAGGSRGPASRRRTTPTRRRTTPTAAQRRRVARRRGRRATKKMRHD